MIKKVLPILMLGAAFFAANGCKNQGGDFKKAKGLEYKISKDAPGKNAATGDIIEVHVIMRVGKGDGKSKDSLIVDSRKNNGGKPIEMMVQEGKFNGDLMAGMSLLSAGDSATFRVSVDSLKKELKGQPMPDFAKPGDYFIYEITMVSVKSKEDAEKARKEKSAGQAKIDDQALLDYFAKNNIKPERTASGLYYTITKPGTGDNIQKGQTVTMNYTGKTMDGKTFDSNMEDQFQHKSPFKFPVGMGQVIAGWDEGVQLLKKGTKAMFYIPSVLAYGEQGPPSIGSNANLIFEVEVLDVQTAPAGAQGGQGAPGSAQ